MVLLPWPSTYRSHELSISLSFSYSCTETYHTKSAQISIFGIPLWYPTNTPRTAISPAVQPGQCWAFKGFPGFLSKFWSSKHFIYSIFVSINLFNILVLKLNSFVHVTGFTIEHIPRILAPNGKIDSAPKAFTVWVSLSQFCIYCTIFDFFFSFIRDSKGMVL